MTAWLGFIQIAHEAKIEMDHIFRNLQYGTPMVIFFAHSNKIKKNVNDICLALKENQLTLKPVTKTVISSGSACSPPLVPGLSR